MKECKICETENPSDSLFCLECGASININNETDTIKPSLKESFNSFTIKDEDRMVSAKEFKDRIYSISFPKSKHAHRLLRKELQREIERWKNDSEYIPLIGAPIKNDSEVKFVPSPLSNIMIDDDGYCTHDTDFKCGLKKNCNLPLGSGSKSLVNVEDRLKSIIPNVPNINHIYGEPILVAKTVPYKKGDYRAIAKTNLYPNNIDGFDDPCGVCGSDKCLEIHKPTIQEQYQEAFENIQRFRRNRLERWEEEQKRKAVQASVAKGLMPPALYRPFPMFEMRKGWDRKKVEDIKQSIDDREEMRKIATNIYGIKALKEKPPQSAITGTDVRKGIRPKTPKERRGDIPTIPPDNPKELIKGDFLLKWLKKSRANRPSKFQWIRR